ncbi:threonine synthase [Auritidibacter ignavus]|uniref:threonine synthase n=1 Tax=Auritidibacter ignavus TaxID=678932 RepID=UPI000F03B684|nr:threonine synthase [Auritidibacter ignavus]NIH72081.1 threonine synthase [Auritidibacter ignavus]RMX23907.1 threonine synthase [Auritidibacter ignavus]
MQYVSTRGGMDPASFSDILLEGLAPDGGLVMPTEIPVIDQVTIESWRELSYPQLAREVIGRYWTETPTNDLEQIVTAAYGDQFSSNHVVPRTQIGDNTWLLDLSQGPTLAFKDMAMQFLGEAIPYVLTERGETLNILGATSGDTGSAAEHAFAAKPNVAVFMLSPQGRMSAFQRAQMYSLTDQNIHNIVVDGVFDDCQHMVKQLNGDLPFKRANTLGTVNSINLGRLVAQCVYYFWGWLRASDEHPGSTEPIDVTVPSGNFGNIFSGQLARLMGLPIRRLVLATNENDVLNEFFRTGVYTPRSAQQTVATSSPSMDISKASNLERLIYLVLGSDPIKLSGAFQALDDVGTLDLSRYQPRFAEEFGMVSGASTHADRLTAIRQTWEHAHVLIDPHTADGVTIAEQYRDDSVPMLVLETAKPEKFSDTVVEAIGQAPELSEDLQNMLEREQHIIEIRDNVDQLRDYIAEHAVR